MNINQNVIFLKTKADTPSLTTARDGASVSRLAENQAAVAAPALTATTASTSATSTLLPSTQGDFDAARVAEIRRNISAGRYRVDTGKIADGLLATVRDLLNKPVP